MKDDKQPPPIDPEKLDEFRKGFSSDKEKMKEILKKLLRKGK